MTPAQYAAKYLNLEVPGANAGDPALATGIKINQYVLGFKKNEAAKDKLYGALRKDFQDHAKDKTFRLTLRVITIDGNTEERAYDSLSDELWQLVRYPFSGKGSPEGVQANLQLASRYGLAPAGLQTYAGKNLGLDCNGFVGNYLRHGRGAAPSKWFEKEDESKPGPNMLITDIMSKATDTVLPGEKMDPSSTYLFAMVNGAGRVIPGGGDDPAAAGHIAITEPNLFKPTVYQPTSFAFAFLAEEGAAGWPAYWTVESTGGGVGLTQSWYGVRPSRTERLEKKVFTVYRSSQAGTRYESLDFQIGRLLV